MKCYDTENGPVHERSIHTESWLCVCWRNRSGWLCSCKLLGHTRRRPAIWCTDHIEHSSRPPCNDCKPLIGGCRQFLLFLHKLGVKRIFSFFCTTALRLLLTSSIVFFVFPTASTLAQVSACQIFLLCLDSLFFYIHLGGTRLSVQSPHWNTALVFTAISLRSPANRTQTKEESLKYTP